MRRNEEGIDDAEDSNGNGCNLGHAERCCCRRSAAQGAASAGASSWQGSDRQVSGRQGSDRQVSTARRDQGLTAFVPWNALYWIERVWTFVPFHDLAPLRRGFCLRNSPPRAPTLRASRARFRPSMRAL